MKNLLIVLFDIISIIGLTIWAFLNRGYFTNGGETFLIAAILAVSMYLLK